jgi:arsenate reductase
MEIWHNPRCSKSRAALKLIEERGESPTVRRYLDDPPTRDELERTLTALGLEPWDIARLGEQRARELGLQTLEHDRDVWIGLLAENPILIERPIVVADDGRAVVGRPVESVLDLIGR